MSKHRYSGGSRTHYCPVCGSYAKSAAVVARHYRKYHTAGGSHYGCWPDASAKYTASVRDLDEEEDVEKLMTAFIPRANRPGLKSPREAAVDKIVRRAQQSRSAYRAFRGQGESRRRAAELVYLNRLEHGSGEGEE